MTTTVQQNVQDHSEPARALGTEAPFRASHETLTQEAQMQGAWPEELTGRLLRTAPAVHEHGTWKSEHWFDGLGLLYSFSIDNNRITYRQRLLDSDFQKRVLGDKRVSKASFGSVNDRSFLRRAFEPVPSVSDNANVHAMKIGNDFVAMTESPHQWLFDPETLAAKSVAQYQDKLGSIAMLAHPQYDPIEKKVCNVGIKIGAFSELVVFEHALNERVRKVIARIRVNEIPYLHSFAITKRYAVIVACPLLANPLSFLWSNTGYIDHFRYQPECATKFYRVDRKSGEVRIFESPAFFFFHTVQAFELGDDVVVDIAADNDASIVSRLSRTRLLNDGMPPLITSLRRFTLDNKTPAVKCEVMLDRAFEFPTIDHSKPAGSAQAIWGTRRSQDGSEIVRFHAGQERVCRMDSYDFGEPVHVPCKASSSVLLAVGSHRKESHSMLLAIDAETMQPVAQATVNVSIPLGFHGSFVRSAVR